ncbi:hypothetical protein D9M72_502710 [compost metagenome]
MLRRQNDRGDFRRLAIDVAHGDLALGVRTELGDFAFALLAGGGEQIEDAVRVVDRRRHKFGGLAAGVAEHDALVAGTLFALHVGSAVDALSDVGGLEVQKHVDLGRLPVEAVLLIADLADRLAGGGLELRGVDDVVAVLVLLQKARRQANLAGDHNAVRRRQRLAGNAHAPGIDTGLGSFTVDQIDDLVGDTVTHLVRMTFGYGFTREQVV